MSPLVPSLSTRGAPNDAILFGKKIRERQFFAKEGCKRRRREKETINCVETDQTAKGQKNKRNTNLSRGYIENTMTHTVQVARAAHHEKTQPRKLNFATTPTEVFVVVTSFSHFKRPSFANLDRSVQSLFLTTSNINQFSTSHFFINQ